VHEIEFIHAVNTEKDPNNWSMDKPFVVPPPTDPLRYALVVNKTLRETHLWAPHVKWDEKN